MSTLVTSTRTAVSFRFLLTAMAGIAVVAALVVSLLAITSGSSTGGGVRPAPYDNSCHVALRGPC